MPPPRAQTQVHTPAHEALLFVVDAYACCTIFPLPQKLATSLSCVKESEHHCHVSKNLSSALVSTETPRAWTQRSWSEVQPSNRPGDSTIMCWITLFPELEPEGFYP